MADTLSYALVECQSGSEPDYLWASLGFSSPAVATDVIHIVVAKEVPAKCATLGHDTVYLERYEQGLSCYGGVEKIAVAENFLLLDLDATGRTALDFCGPLQLTECASVSGYGQALKLFEQMCDLHCGRAIQFARRS